MKVDLRALKSMLYKINMLDVNEALITIRNNKIHGRYVDPAHVALLDMTLHIKGCTLDKPETIGIDVSSLKFKIQSLPMGIISKRELPENNIRIKTVVERGKICGLKFQHPMLKFQKNLVDSASFPSEPTVPKGLLETIPVTANINTRQLKIFLKIAEGEIDHITLIAEKKGNKLRAVYETDDCEVTETDLTYSLGGIEGTDLQFTNTSEERTKAIFTVDYMQQFLSNLKAPTIKIGLKNDSPLVIWWKEEDLLEGIYMLAPRIESE